MIALSKLLSICLGLDDHKEASKAQKYPAQPGAKRKGTSQEAAASMDDAAPLLRQKCLQVLLEHPSTADEVAKALGESVLSVRPRISELVALGAVKATGIRRKNSSGRNAIVWRVLP